MLDVVYWCLMGAPHKQNRGIIWWRIWDGGRGVDINKKGDNLALDMLY